jgi:hypothetical protein
MEPSWFAACTVPSPAGAGVIGWTVPFVEDEFHRYGAPPFQSLRPPP